MKIYLLIALTTIFYYKSKAQSLSPQVIATSGGFLTNSKGSLSVTIGELTGIETLSNTSINLILTQGFQQNNAATVSPLKLISFTGTREKNTVLLNWLVQNEVAIKQYEIERSTDGIQFFRLDEVIAKNNGQPKNKNNYIDKDAKPITIYYRLLIKEMDGRDWYSWILKITGNGSAIKVYPIPVKKEFVVAFTLLKSETKELSLLNAGGHLLWVKSYQLKAGSQQLTIDLGDQPAGNYILNGLDEKGILIIKQ